MQGVAADWRTVLLGGELHDGHIRNIRPSADGSSLSMNVYGPNPGQETLLRFRRVPLFTMRERALLNVDVPTSDGGERPAVPDDFDDYDTRDLLKEGRQGMIFLDAEAVESFDDTKLLHPLNQRYHHVRVVAHPNWELLIVFDDLEVVRR